MAQFSDFIPVNVATKGARRIGIYDAQGNRVGQIPLGNLSLPNVGEKLYSFGLLSDVHLTSETAQTDFEQALAYLNENEDVVFTCITGDITNNGTASELSLYKSCVDTYSPNTPVYTEPGNHECYANSVFFADWAQYIQLPSTYTGVPPRYYAFNHDEDVFIFMGVQNDWEGHLFDDGSETWTALDWLAATLDANKDKRCFLFEHVRPQDGCGNALGIYAYDIWGDATSASVNEATVFENLLRQYPNVILFHGHSHLRFRLQAYSDHANYDKLFGCHSVHVPSISVPRDTNSAVNPSLVDLYAESEGYVVDVYANGIHLRGRDFAKGEFLPIASYWLDTTL